MIGRLKAMLRRLVPSRCAAQSDALRRASELHAYSSLAVGNEARKIQARVGDLKVIADAAEKRAGLRAAEDAAERRRAARQDRIFVLVDDMLNGPRPDGAKDQGEEPC